jgi:hypothetical protein
MGLTDTMVHVIFCPECLAEFWLTDEEVFEPGIRPQRAMRQNPISFICCGKTQTVSAASITYKKAKVEGTNIRK